MKLGTSARNAIANAFVDLIDGGSGAGTLRIRTGSPPANPQASETGTLLAVLTFSDPAFGTAAVGVCTADTIAPDTSVNATGVAGWFRIENSSGTALMDGTVGGQGSGDDIEFDDINFIAGGTAQISELTVSCPES